MAGDHKCPVCSSTFTRPQHVARHMRSHTGDRPYKCTHCGDQFARSDLLSRHVNKCHASEKPPTTTQPARRKGHAQPGSSASSGVRGPAPALIPPPGSRKVCDACSVSRTPAQCDAGLPCGKCLQRNTKCTYVKALEVARRQIVPSQGIPLQQPQDLFHPPTTVPSMGLPSSMTSGSSLLFPSHSSFNFSVPMYQSTGPSGSSSAYLDASGNQGSTHVATLPPLPAAEPIPSYQQALSFAPYPSRGNKTDLDGHFLPSNTHSANHHHGSSASPSGFLYDPATLNQRASLPNIGYPGYTPPSTTASGSNSSTTANAQLENSPRNASPPQPHGAYTQQSPDSKTKSVPSSKDPISSALGLMSLDDPIIAAEMSKSGSFFAPGAMPGNTPSNTNLSSTSTSSINLPPPASLSGPGVTPLLGPSKWPSVSTGSGLLTPGFGLGSYGWGAATTGFSTGLTPWGGPSLGSGTGLTPGRAGDASLNDLKDFWKQFMKMPGEKTPGVGGLIPVGFEDTADATQKRSLPKVASSSNMKTTQACGMPTANPNVMGEDLRSYEQAVLARKAPVLTLPKRARSGGTTNPQSPPQEDNTTPIPRAASDKSTDSRRNSPSPAPSTSTTASIQSQSSSSRPRPPRPSFKRIASKVIGREESKSLKLDKGSALVNGDDEAPWTAGYEEAVERGKKTTRGALQQQQQQRDGASPVVHRLVRSPSGEFPPGWSEQGHVVSPARRSMSVSAGTLSTAGIV